MLHPRLALVAALAVPAAGAAQAIDKQKLCTDLDRRAPTLGAFATYNWIGGQTDGSTLRFAVIGKEQQQGAAYYWVELTMNDPKRGANGKTIIQMLTPGLGSQVSGVRSVIMKTGDQPAMRLPEQMVRMMANNLSSNMATDMTRNCGEMHVVGWEQVTVPAGAFRALHLRHARDSVDVWVQPELPFAIVKATLKAGGTMALAGQGTGATSSITETPRDMPGFPPRD